MTSPRTLAVAAALAALLGLGIVGGFGSAARATIGSTGTMSFTDPSGDSNGAPDVTAVTVSDDYTTGAMQFVVTAGGYSTIDVAKEPELYVFIDSDRNAATGSSGLDYALNASRDSSGSYWDVLRWDGSKFVEVAQSSTISFSRSGDTMTWSLNKSDLGGTTGLNFGVLAGIYDSSGNISAMDRAPDGGSWSYTLSTAPPPPTTTAPPAVVKPVIGAATIAPRAIAGKRVTVTFPVTRSDTGAALTTGKMICDPSVQGKVITHEESFTGGTAKLKFTIPMSAKGKTLKVKVTIKAGSQSATRVASFHIG